MNSEKILGWSRRSLVSFLFTGSERNKRRGRKAEIEGRGREITATAYWREYYIVLAYYQRDVRVCEVQSSGGENCHVGYHDGLRSVTWTKSKDGS